MEKIVRYSIFDFQMEKLVRYSTFDIRYSDGEISSIFDIRTAAVDHLIRVKTFFGNRKVTEYQVFNIKTNF